MNENHSAAQPISYIKPSHGWAVIKIRDLLNYRELLYFLAKRDIMVRYKQTVLGVLWAVMQPFFTMVVFTLFFGRMAKMPSDGMPYPLFVYAGLLPWTYFANSLSQSASSLLGNVNLVTKIYFPRVVIPTSRVIAGLVDFFLALMVLAGMMIYYHVYPSKELLLLPFLIVVLFFCSLGFGYWLSALNVQFRDIQYTIPFVLQLWMFISPVIYSGSLMNKNHPWIYLLNPLSGLIQAFRISLLGNGEIEWFNLWISVLASAGIFLTGLVYFRSMESGFADKL